MSKRKRKKPESGATPRAPAPQPAGPTRWTQKRRITVAAVGAATGLALIAWGTAHHGRSAAGAPLPPPSAGAGRTPVSYADFVGSPTCRECHAAQYARWERSTHGRAGGPPTADRVIAPFGGAPILFMDAVVRPSVDGRDGYSFTVAQEGRPARVFPVAAVVGGGFMAGGGTQAFFTRNDDGTLRFLPFDYSAHGRAWFCGTSRGWVPITPALRLEECVEWPPSRVLGGHSRFASCEQCHGSQISLMFDTTARAYATRFTTLAINCESCHGPGRRHVALARSGAIDTAADIGMQALATLDKDASSRVCYQCHSLKTEVRPGFLSGEPLEDYFSLNLPMLVRNQRYPDGRVREFAYQEGQSYSDCYLNGSMRCTDCHDPHAQSYRDVTGTPLRGRFADGQCLGCHASKAGAPERHTHHRAGSPGSRCVSCHMPYLQEALVGDAVRYARSDHTIPIPRPAFDTQEGVPTACGLCHQGVSVDTLEAQVQAWYGELKPHHTAVTRLMQADGVADRGAAAELLLTIEPRHAAARFAALLRFMTEYLGPDLPDLEPDVVDRLERLSSDPDLDIQSLALASLHLARGEDPQVRRTLTERLGALGPRATAVRARWRWILSFLGDAYLERRQFARATTTYRKAEELEPGDPAVLGSVGRALSSGGDFAGAVRYFRSSLERAPGNPETLVNLAYALGQGRDVAGASAAYQRAIAANPWEPMTHYSFGNFYTRIAQPQRAIQEYERALALDPGLDLARRALERVRGAGARALP